MRSKIEKIPAYRMAYVRKIGPYGATNVDAMEALKKWATERKLLENSILFAIAQDNPQLTPPEKCRFDACIVIENNYPLEDSIEEAYSMIFSDIQLQRLFIDNRPIVERYTWDKLSQDLCEICVPVLCK